MNRGFQDSQNDGVLRTAPKQVAGCAPTCDRRAGIRNAVIAASLLLGLVSPLLAVQGSSPAPTTVQRSSDENPSSTTLLRGWQCTLQPRGTEVEREDLRVEGEELTRFRVVSLSSAEAVRFVAATEPSLLHSDFTATIRIHSTLIGSRLALELLVPGQTDPVTGQPLVLYLPGDAIESERSWHELTVTATERNVQAAVRRARAERNRADINAIGAVITGLAILSETVPGESWMDLASVEYGPVMRLPQEVSSRMQAMAASSEVVLTEARGGVPLDIELGALLLNGTPGILRLIPDHNESTDLIRGLGVNSVWISDFRNRIRAKEWALGGIAVLATPPQPQFESEKFDQLQHGLPPLDQMCPDVSAWYLGTRVSPRDLPRLLGVTREVRNADRMYQRPQLADVTGVEGAVSREIDLIGIGHHVVGRDEGFGAQRNNLFRRWRNSGQHGFPWTWIQVEPSTTQQRWRMGLEPQVVEPEQILHQVRAALSAGYRGIGFWKTRPLEVSNPLDREIMLAIELACLEISLLEPFLAQGRHAEFLTLRDRAELSDSERSLTERRRPGRSLDVSLDREAVQSDASVIRTNRTSLILANAWDNDSQFVPAPMFALEVGAVVAATETSSAWRVSVTGVRSLPREVAVGGLQIRLRNFDRSANVIVTADTAVVRELEQKVLRTAPRAARLWIDLATLKLERVIATLEKIVAVHKLPSGSDKLLNVSRNALDQAEQEIRTGNYDEARLLAEDCLRHLRQVQTLCWKDAIRTVASPAGFPHATSFSTLANHWQQIRDLREEQQRLSVNLLPQGSADFGRSRLRDGWVREEQAGDFFATAHDVISFGGRPRYMRMAAWFVDASIGNAGREDLVPLILKSPGVPVQSGDLMLVTGRVRRGVTVASDRPRPLRIYDSELGAEYGLRIRLDRDWSDFMMLRPVQQDGDFHVLLSLSGQAEVHFDDIEIRRLSGTDRGSGSLSNGAVMQLLGNTRIQEENSEAEFGGKR